MSKITRLLSILLLVVMMTPAVLANDDQPVYIKSAVVKTENNLVKGTVTVCNSERERVSFVLDVKNTTINRPYKRKLTVGANECLTTDLDFWEDFAEMSNTGDRITMQAQRVRGTWTRRYDYSDKYYTKVVKGDRDYAGCSDHVGDDGIYDVCEMDFIDHEPSGLRVKVLENDWYYAVLKLTHIEWGGTKEVRIYKGRSKDFRSAHDQLERVEITNVYGDNTRDLILKLES